MRASVVWEVSKTTFREFWRTPEAVFWTYGFPVVIAVVLGFAFQPRDPVPVPVAVVTAEDGGGALLEVLVADPRLDAKAMSEAEALVALARGRVSVMAAGDARTPRLRSDAARPESELGLLLVQRALRVRADGPGSISPQMEQEERPGSRYIDFLVPGLLGLNLLGSGMWGVGFNLVQMRTANLLRRLTVTPMARSEFLLGYLCSRLILAIPETLAIVLFGTLVLGVPFRGSWLSLAVLTILGASCFAGLGTLVASRARSIEAVAGLMNLVQIPMWLLGGSFFSNERFDGVMRWVADAMPLTWLNAALRDCMLEPTGFFDVAGTMALLAGFTVACFFVALRVFRWT